MLATKAKTGSGYQKQNKTTVGRVLFTLAPQIYSYLQLLLAISNQKLTSYKTSSLALVSNSSDLGLSLGV